MLNQAVDRRRCGSCARWQGPRQPGTLPDTVAIAAETDTGQCLGGGWDGDLRRARCACGHWRRWPVLAPLPAAPSPTTDAPPCA